MEQYLLFVNKFSNSRKQCDELIYNLSGLRVCLSKPTQFIRGIFTLFLRNKLGCDIFEARDENKDIDERKHLEYLVNLAKSDVGNVFTYKESCDLVSEFLKNEHYFLNNEFPKEENPLAGVIPKNTFFEWTRKKNLIYVDFMPEEETFCLNRERFFKINSYAKENGLRFFLKTVRREYETTYNR